jgi:hypothetical protein
MGLLPNEIEDPYPDTVEYFTSIEEKMREFTFRPICPEQLLTACSPKQRP